MPALLFTQKRRRRRRRNQSNQSQNLLQVQPQKDLLIHDDYAYYPWFDGKWLAKSIYDIFVIWNWDETLAWVKFYKPLSDLLSFKFSKTSMSAISYAFQDFNVFSFMLSKTSMSSLLHFQRLQCLFTFFSKTSTFFTFIGLNVLCFYAFKNFKCLFLLSYRTPMSSILCFLGLQGPLFDVTGPRRFFFILNKSHPPQSFLSFVWHCS